MKSKNFSEWCSRSINRVKELFAKDENLPKQVSRLFDVNAQTMAVTEPAYSPKVLAKWARVSVKKVLLWDVFDKKNNGYIATIWVVIKDEKLFWIQVGCDAVYVSSVYDLIYAPAHGVRLVIEEQPYYKLVACCSLKDGEMVVNELVKVRTMPLFEEDVLECEFLPCSLAKLVNFLRN